MLEYIIFAIIAMGLLYYKLFYKDDYNDYKPTIHVKDEFREEIAEERLEEIIPPTELVYSLNTHKIKYLVFDSNSLICSSSIEFYQRIILEKRWLDEPFYSTIFKILLLIDSDEFFIKDVNSKVIITNIRDKNNKTEKIKSYQVFSTLHVIKLFFRYALADINNFNKIDAQDITLACLILILSKSKHFETLQTCNFDDLYLDNYDRKAQIKNIYYLIKSNNNQLTFIEKSLERAFYNTYKKPYVEKIDEVLKLELLPELPQKILMHI